MRGLGFLLPELRTDLTSPGYCKVLMTVYTKHWARGERLGISFYRQFNTVTKAQEFYHLEDCPSRLNGSSSLTPSHRQGARGRPALLAWPWL